MASPKKHSGGQLILPLTLDDKASFENFYAGDNCELVDALRTMVVTKKIRVVYFYGNSGAGKSHLMFALLRLAKETELEAQYFSLSEQRLTVELLEASNDDAIICVDDIQNWAGDEAKERALFALFERTKRGSGALLLSASQPPEQCGFELQDLVSRLGSGLVYPLYGLSDTQYFAAIKLRAEQRGMSISDDTVKYLISRSARETKELFLLLEEIDRASLIEKRRITIPFLQSILR